MKKSKTKGAPAAPKHQYQNENSLNAPSDTGTQTNVPGKGSCPPESPLHALIFTQMNSGKSKGDVLLAAIKANCKQEEPGSNEDVLALVEELFATLDKEMSDKDLLVKLTDEMIVLFSDDLAEPYFFCEGIPFRAPSRQVEALIKHRFYRIKEYLPAHKDVREVFDILESKARFDAPKVKMFNRMGKADNAFYYDLCDKRFLKMTSSGWEFVPAFPLFRRYKHQQAQVEPVTGGNVWDVFKLLTIAEEDQLLVMVFLISLFIPGIAHPILAVCGDQGSAKSFLCNIINRLIDPTLTERIIQPKNERDLIQTLRQKYVSVLDNISKIDQRVSDILCQVCTGGGVSYRQLYTDEGENIAQFRHVVIINSIMLPIVNADLMDRAIILKLQRITQDKRKPEQDLWNEFNIAQPGILGGIFDIIVKAMAIYPTVKIDKLPRLADFAKWGYAIAQALGKSGEQFLKDLSQNVQRQNESVAEKNVLCKSILTFMGDKSTHLNSVYEVHKELKIEAGDDAKDETFPKLPHNLRGQLDLLRSTLQEHGISYHYFDRQKNGVKILLSNSSVSDSSVPTETDTPAASIPEVKLLKSLPGVADGSDVADFEKITGMSDVPADELLTLDFDENFNFEAASV